MIDSGEPDQLAQPTLPDRDIWKIVAGLMPGSFLSVLDVLIVITALPTIVGDLGGASSISWVITAYLLSSTAAGPLFGKLSDLFGRMQLYQLAVVIFVVGSVLAALSHDMGQLIVARAVQGVGSGGLMALPSAMVADVSAPRHRARFQSVTILNFTIASAVGPLIGGVLVDQVSWRWIFWVNLPLGALALLTCARLPYPRRPRPDRVVVDYSGFALIVAITICVLLAVSRAETNGGFGRAPVIAMLGASAVMVASLIVVERRAAEPALPMRFFANARFSLMSVASVVFNLAIQAAWILMPIWFQVVTGASATVSGLLVLPFVIGNTLAAISSGRLISRWGRYKWAPVLGQALTLGAFILYATMSTGTSRLTATIYMAVAGIGIGFVLNVIGVIIQNSVSVRDLGAATGALGLFRSIGASFGAAVGLGVYSSHLVHALRAALPPAVARHVPAAALQGAPGAIRALRPPVHGQVVGAFAAALHSAYLVAAPCVAVALVITLVMRELPPSGQEETGPDLAAELASAPESAGAIV